MGIIKALKSRYKLHLAEDQIMKLEQGKSIEVNLLEALRILRQSLDEITVETIKNCYRKAGFVHAVKLLYF